MQAINTWFNDDLSPKKLWIEILKGEWQQKLVELAEVKGSAVQGKGKDSSAKPSDNTCGLHGKQ